jgi:hypothetical protein
MAIDPFTLLVTFQDGARNCKWGCMAVTSNSDKQTEFLISLSPISAVWFLMTTFFEKQCFVVKNK